MSDPDSSERTGAIAAAPRRRRPAWVWLLLGLLALAVLAAILLGATQCSSDDPAAGSAGAPGGPPAGAPAGAPPGSPTGGAGGAASPPAAGSPAPGAGGSASTDVAGLQSRIDQIVAAQPVTFRPDSPELTTTGADSLERVARELASAPGARITVTGYAAPARTIGNPVAQQLSERRATVVAQRLSAAGISGERTQTRGAGDTNPRPSLIDSRRAEITVS